MKRTLLDKIIGTLSPEAERKRIISRVKTELIKRSYDAAQTFQTDDWTSASKGGVNIETRGAQTTLRSKGRDAVRNNPYATKAINVIVSNTVGSGIMPNISGTSNLQTKRIQAAWKQWAESTLCDSNRRHNFYGLQALALRSTAESGEVIALKEINKESMSLRILESDYIVSYKETISSVTDPESIVQGIKLDSNGRVKSYFLYKSHPGEVVSSLANDEISADRVCHVYRQDRPGQVRGITWFHSVLRAMADLSSFQESTLIAKKIQACFSVLIKTTGEDLTLSAADLAIKRANENMLEPGSIRYLNQGEEAQMVAPAASQDYDPFTRATLRTIASGLGITYESLTSDYSQVNFSSGRMGHLEFRRNVDMWRWGMLIPQFCEPAFEHFLKWCQIAKGIDTTGVTCQWVPPAWSMIDPEKEIAASVKAIRNGLMSYKTAVREQGYDPEQVVNEIAESNQLLDDGELILDSDPRKVTQAGIFQIVPAQQTGSDNQSQDSATAPVPPKP